jgi:PAS domain S-box-containing protein
MGEGFILLSNDFRVLEINSEGLRIDGRPRDEIIGRHLLEVWPEVEQLPTWPAYQKGLAEKTAVQVEYRHVSEQHDVWLEVRGYPIDSCLAVFYRDITDRKTTEALLKRTRADALNKAVEREAILSQLSEGVIVTDTEGQIIFVNEAAEALHGVRLLGVPPEEYADAYRLLRLDGEPYPSADLPLARAVRGEVVANARWRIQRPDGTEVLAIGSAQPIVAYDGERLGAVLTVRDDTERNAAERALSDSEERFRFALEAAGGIGTWDWDVATDIVSTSEQFARMYGLDPERAAKGLPLAEYVQGIHPDDQPLVDRLIDEAVKCGGEYRAEYRILGHGGEVRWVIARGRCLKNAQGEPVRFPGVTFDITERRSAEDALQQTSRRLDAIINNTLMAVFLMDDRQQCVFANAAAERLTGYSFQELQSRPLHDVIHNKKPDGSHYPLEECPIDRAFPERAQVQGEELFVAPDGSFYPVAFTASPLLDDNGKPIGTVIEARNIAKEKARDAALHELNATLERRVKEAIAERERVEEALRQSQKMEAVGQLTGGIAHDFNNLLTVVTGNIDMALRNLANAGVGEGRVKRSLDNAMKGAERAATLTQRLLAFSRRQPLDPKPLNVDRLVADMSDLLNRAVGETIRLEVVTSPGLWRVEADPNQLESAILNLTVNARDAMPTGGTLTVETANARLDEAYAAEHAEVAPGHYVVVAVTDTGHGMPRDVAARVFEPFFTTKEVGRGTGLGLSQVYGFSKQSGGHVKIYSDEGRGTTVKIYLPRLFSEAENEDEPPTDLTARDVSRGRETIMVVEDDDDVRVYTVDCLRELGYQVLEAHDGPSALRLLERQEQPIDLLFTDVVMPGMTGRELADHARQLQPDLKVLYTSGYTRNAIVHAGRLDEGVEMVTKPFTYQVLAEKIADMLEIGRTGRLLLVEDDATVRMFAAEALVGVGYAVDEAASSAEALSRIRVARGRYDAVVLDARLPDRAGEGLAAELRALHADMPILIASGEHAETLAKRFADDRCTRVIAKPYNAATLTRALEGLGLSCRGQDQASDA